MSDEKRDQNRNDKDDTKNPIEALADEARARAARASAEAAIDAAGAAASRLAHGVLDGIESLMFGKVGAAEEAAKKDDGDPLERLRGRYNAEPKSEAKTEPQAPPPPKPAKPDPVAEAQKQLNALKAARKAGPTDVKKTL